jgi:hypothetical protein
MVGHVGLMGKTITLRELPDGDSYGGNLHGGWIVHATGQELVN